MLGMNVFPDCLQLCAGWNETLIRGLYSGNQPRLTFCLRILQFIETGHKWSDYSLAKTCDSEFCPLKRHYDVFFSETAILPLEKYHIEIYVKG